MAYHLMQNDGHNSPTVWKFQDREQALDWLLRNEDVYVADDARQCFEQLGEWEDPNGDMWSELGVDPKLHVNDMTNWKPT